MAVDARGVELPAQPTVPSLPPPADIGALMRNKLLVAPKLRGQSEERDTIPAALSQPAHAAAAAALPAAAPAATAQPPAAPAPRQQSPTPDSPVPPQANLSQLDVTDNPAFSPDDSLAKAQAKLASLKAAADMLKQTSAATAGRPQSGAAASLSAASFKFTATTGAAAAAAPAAATEPAGPRVAGMPAPVQPSPTPPLPQPSESPSLAHALQGRTRRAAPAATPEYRPEEDADEEDAQQLEEEAAAELAARSALQKRHRRRSVHPQRSSRFGEWFTGGDEELDKTLQLYNLEEAEPRVRRSQRRKSAFPTLGKLQAAEESEEEVRVDAATGGYGGAVVKEMAPRRAGTRRKTLAPGDDVAARVAAVTDELCAKLDGLIEPEPEEPNEKGRRCAVGTALLVGIGVAVHQQPFATC